MLLVEFTINGTVHYISNEKLALTHFYHKYIDSFTPPQYRMATKHGGYVSLQAGDISLNPDLFSGDWPPPKQCTITAKYTATTEGAAITLFECDAYLEGFGRESVSYDLFSPKYAKKLLTQGPDYNGDTVPYPRAFGLVTHQEPLRLADDGSGRPCYHLAGVASSSTGIKIIGLSSASGGAAITVITDGAHGYSNSETVYLNGFVNLNGAYTISNVTSTTFQIAATFPTENTETLPLTGAAFQSGELVVCDDGVPIMEKVVVNGDGTFSLTLRPVGRVTISGVAAQTDLEEIMTWGQGQLGITSIDTTYARATSPDVSCWETSQRALIDFLSEISASFVHYFYIENDTLTLGDMLLDNGSATVAEKAFFRAGYSQEAPTSRIKVEWETHEAATGAVNNDGTNVRRFVRDITNRAILSLSTVSSGTTDGTTANKLVHSAATFITDGIKTGMVAYNVDDDTESIVTAVAQTELTLEDDIFVSGEEYNVGPDLPYGNEITVTPFHDTRSNILTALQNILTVLNLDKGEIRLPFSSSLPNPGKKFTWEDTSLGEDTDMYIRGWNLTFDFDNDELSVKGGGVTS